MIKTNFLKIYLFFFYNNLAGGGHDLKECLFNKKLYRQTDTFIMHPKYLGIHPMLLIHQLI